MFLDLVRTLLCPERTQATRQDRRVRLQIESLEERAMPSATLLTPSLGTAQVRTTQPAQMQVIYPAAATSSAIDAKYASLGGASGFLGKATSAELTSPSGQGHYRAYSNGYIFWSPATGAHEVHGAILSEWAKLGWDNSVLGFPTTDESAMTGGRYNAFQHGDILWSAATGAHEVHGAILSEYARIGWQTGVLGMPISDELQVANGGRESKFQYGVICWTPSTGAHEIHGAILSEWTHLGADKSFLGYPTTDESAAVGGRFNNFQYGSIYWSSASGAHEVHGAIRERWVSMGAERSSLGFPTQDESATPENFARYSDFQHGAISWASSTGTVVLSQVSQYASDRSKLNALGTSFPYLKQDYEVWGGSTPNYNCIAFSLGITTRWVWPGTTLADFDKLDGQYGYHRMSTLDYSLQPGIQKIVLYGKMVNGQFEATHQALQMPDGSWESKLGSLGLVRHLTPGFLDGPGYGQPYAVYWRNRP